MKHPKPRLAVLVWIALLAFPAVGLGLDVGDKAPAFTAESTRGTISLNDYAGRQHVVLALYFAVFTPV